MPQDHVETFTWFTFGAGQGGTMAETKRDALAKTLILEQIAEGNRLSKTMLPKVSAPDK